MLHDWRHMTWQHVAIAAMMVVQVLAASPMHSQGGMFSLRASTATTTLGEASTFTPVLRMRGGAKKKAVVSSLSACVARLPMPVKID
jgi:hypothetical protein